MCGVVGAERGSKELQTIFYDAKETNFVEKTPRYAAVVDVGGRANIRRLMALGFAIGGDGWSDLANSGRNVHSGNVEGDVGLADRDSDELGSSLVYSEGVLKIWVVLLGLVDELLVVSYVSTQADIKYDEGDVLAVEGGQFRGDI